MTNEIQIFNNPQFGEIRTAGTSEQPLFCLADVCRVLELQTGATKNRLDQKGVSSINTLTKGGNQQLVFINEKNLYKVIMRSDKPQAEPFQDWVCGEVLPTIRKHGAYLTPAKIEEVLLNPDTIIKLATELKEERELRIAAEEENVRLNLLNRENDKIIEASNNKIKILAPKADYVDRVLASQELFDTTQIAQDYGMSANRLNKILSELRIQRKVNKQWILYSDYQNKGYVHSETIELQNCPGKVVMHTKWTQQGRKFLYFKLKQHGYLPLMDRAV